MASVTGVVNSALRMIGATRITSLTDGTANANVANDMYEDIRDDMLRSHPWNFATKRVQLARLSTAPAFEFDYAYALPSDWLRTISVHPDDAAHGTMLNRMEVVDGQNAIVCSADAVYMRYIAKITDPNKWAADFRAAMELALARDLAVPLAGSNAMHEMFAKRFMSKLAQARSTDGMGSFPELRPKGSWATARGGARNDTYLGD